MANSANTAPGGDVRPCSIGSPRSKVLVVDDTEANLKAFEMTLATLDVDLVLVSSAREAFRHLLREDFAVILLDIRMPVMNGIEAATLMRKGGRAQHTPIIFVSAYEKTPLEVSEGHLAGAIDYLFSPVDPETLKRKVRGYLDAHRKNQELRLRADELSGTVEQQKARIRQLEETVRLLRGEAAERSAGLPG